MLAAPATESKTPIYKKQKPKKRKGQTQSAVLAIRTKEVPGGVPKLTV